jgi:hypothetical protein
MDKVIEAKKFWRTFTRNAINLGIKWKVRHIRTKNGSMTIVVIDDGIEVVYGVSFCNKKDTFSKAIGRWGAAIRAIYSPCYIRPMLINEQDKIRLTDMLMLVVCDYKRPSWWSLSDFARHAYKGFI